MGDRTLDRELATPFRREANPNRSTRSQARPRDFIKQASLGKDMGALKRGRQQLPKTSLVDNVTCFP